MMVGAQADTHQVTVSINGLQAEDGSGLGCIQPAEGGKFKQNVYYC